MATITTYQTLQDAMTALLGHTLQVANYPTIIQLFESAANRRLRVRQQEALTSLSTTSGSVALPADYLSWRRVFWAGSAKIELEYVQPSYLVGSFPTLPAGTPSIFTIAGTIAGGGESKITVMPYDDTSPIILDYFQKIPSLSDSATSNWLLLAHPDLYLFGAMVEAELFGVNDERAPIWKARRDEIFDEIEKLSNKTRGGGAIRVWGATP